MANQLANAIQAARAFQESREALDEVSKLHQHYLLDQWDTYINQQKSVMGYQLTEKGITAKTGDETFKLPPEAHKILEIKYVLNHGFCLFSSLYINYQVLNVYFVVCTSEKYRLSTRI